MTRFKIRLYMDK